MHRINSSINPETQQTSSSSNYLHTILLLLLTIIISMIAYVTLLPSSSYLMSYQFFASETPLNLKIECQLYRRGSFNTPMRMILYLRLHIYTLPYTLTMKMIPYPLSLSVHTLPKFPFLCMLPNTYRIEKRTSLCF